MDRGQEWTRYSLWRHNSTISRCCSCQWCGLLHPRGAHMSTRSTAAEPRALEPRPAHANGVNGTQARLKPAATGEKSVIGNDLKIIGQGLKIIGRGVLQVDGEIEGDVQAVGGINGEQGKGTGMGGGERGGVPGKVSWGVLGKNVLLPTSYA